ncbi:MAG: polyprenol phosphomannose-dependent alpha 1,6 mannosyltransferase MptB [Rhodothermaceae bacterium]|nr:polyprenol phosphomannose-dependent alpha 1,6 mannosyltransferase MptB [Rhodothermaceae bacterium]
MNRQITAFSGLFALLLAYTAYVIEREQYLLLTGAFSLMFVLMAVIYFRSDRETSPVVWIAAGIFLRAIVLFSVPALSEDYYRFIWDGMLIMNGINPFAFTPAQIIDAGLQLPAIAPQLLSGMNSPEYYSIYPAVCQGVFAASWFIAGESIFWNIVTIRLFILAAESATLILMYRLIASKGIDSRNLIWYALNPVVILELTGNLHFEALMICFLFLTWWLLSSGRIYGAAIAFALAVQVKLVPLILIPWLFFRFGFRQGLKWILATGLIIAGLSIPSLSGTVLSNFSDSLGLYFRTFEFNAGLYYAIREIGYWFKGYNIIATLGPALAIAGTVVIIAFSLYLNYIQRTTFALSVVIIFTVHLFFATTVHPWYIVTIIAFSVFSGLLYPVIWSVFLPLSYHAYSSYPYEESVPVVIFIYCCVIAAIIYDCTKSRMISVFLNATPDEEAHTDNSSD